MALRNSFTSILTQNEKIINGLDDVKTIAGWYQEAKRDPKKIPSIIVNKLIEVLLSQSKKYFIDSLNESIEMKCQVDLQRKEVRGDLHINLNSLRPFVEFTKIVDGEKVPPTFRVTFKIDIDGTLEGLTITFGRTNSALEGVKKEIALRRLSFDLTISIIKLPGFNLDPPLVLSHNEIFKVKDLRFYF